MTGFVFEISQLHLLLGIANDLLENFLSFVDERKGLGLQFTGVLKEAYKKEWKAIDEFNDTNQALTCFGLVRGAELATLRLTRQQLNEWIRCTDDFTLTERQEMANDKQKIQQEIKELESQKKKLKKKHEDARNDLKQAKKEREDLQENTQDNAVPLRFKIERLALKPFYIEKAAYWGKLVGNGCRRLLGNATSIFNIAKEILMEEATRSGMDEEGINNVKVRCEMTRDACILFDGFFSALSVTSDPDGSKKKLLRNVLIKPCSFGMLCQLV